MGVQSSLPKDRTKYGFRIYNLIKDSPLDKHGVHLVSDFILPPKELENSSKPFCDWVTENAGKVISLTIYSLTDRKFNTVKLKANDLHSKEGVLGASVKYECWYTAHKNVLRVLKVVEKSFADSILGLKEHEDFIVAVEPEGSKIISLNEEDKDPLTILSETIHSYGEKECTFYIFNEKTKARKVKAKISKNFVLGCDVGYGKLHEFPVEEKPKKNPADDDIVVENVKTSGTSFNGTKEEIVKDPEREKEETKAQEQKVNGATSEQDTKKPQEEPPKEEKKEEKPVETKPEEKEQSPPKSEDPPKSEELPKEEKPTEAKQEETPTTEEKPSTEEKPKEEKLKQLNEIIVN